MDFRKLLRDTRFKGEIDYLIPLFKNAGIENMEQVQNLPVLLRGIRRVDPYILVEELNNAHDRQLVTVMENKKEMTVNQKVEKPKSRSVSKPSTKPVLEDPISEEVGVIEINDVTEVASNKEEV